MNDTPDVTPQGLSILRSPDENAAVERLHELGRTDGLPVIVPTEARVDRMVLAGGLEPNLSLGSIGPYGGMATVENVAVCAVMAGCLPHHFAVVLAAARALCDPVLDVGEAQVTTHGLGPMVIVNGPARYDYGPFESGFGALGPGNRANASVGRAVRLCLINIGGGRAGVGDMAVLGQPGKYTFCLAEAEEESPFPPLHVRLGYRQEQSSVTVSNVEAPHSVLCTVSDDNAESSRRILEQLAAAAGVTSSNNANSGAGTVAVILNPSHAHVLAGAGYSVDDIREAVCDLAAKPRRLLPFTPAGSDEDLDQVIRQSAENILVFVAGGEGVYSAVAPSWGFGVHQNAYATYEIHTGEACAVAF